MSKDLFDYNNDGELDLFEQGVQHKVYKDSYEKNKNKSTTIRRGKTWPIVIFVFCFIGMIITSGLQGAEIFLVILALLSPVAGVSLYIKYVNYKVDKQHKKLLKENPGEDIPRPSDNVTNSKIIGVVAGSFLLFFVMMFSIAPIHSMIFNIRLNLNKAELLQEYGIEDAKIRVGIGGIAINDHPFIVNIYPEEKDLENITIGQIRKIIREVNNKVSYMTRNVAYVYLCTPDETYSWYWAYYK